MPLYPLKTAIGTYGVTKALKDGSIGSDHLQFGHIQVDPIILAMRRMVRDLEYDLSEMAFTTYLCARDFNKPITAIPVFLTRNFHHWAMVYNVHSGIRSPKDLEGRNVGVNRGYTVTTGLWARGILQTEYDVDLNSITWFPTDDEHVQEYQAPPNVLPEHRGKDIAELLLTGEIDAAVGDIPIGSSNVQPLIPDAANAEFEYFRRTGVYPINHGLVIKNSVLETEPWIAEEIFCAFKAAKEVYLAHLASGKDLTTYDEMALALQHIVGADPFPYGISPNFKALETITQLAMDQRITQRKMSVEELFAPGTLKLE